MGMMADAHGPDFEFFQTYCSPADVGHAACARHRTYVVGMHTERSRNLHDVWDLQDAISETARLHVATKPSDYLISTTAEVLLEAQEVARRRSVPFQEGLQSLNYLLTSRERRALSEYEAAYLRRCGKPAQEDANLLVFLGDDPSYSLSWSLNGTIPTFRMNSRTGFYWSPRYRRWLTARERLACLGWPVTPEVASTMTVPQVPAMDIKRAGDLAGNSMHFTQTGVQQLIALACFGPA